VTVTDRPGLKGTPLLKNGGTVTVDFKRVTLLNTCAFDSVVQVIVNTEIWRSARYIELFPENFLVRYSFQELNKRQITFVALERNTVSRAR